MSKVTASQLAGWNWLKSGILTLDIPLQGREFVLGYVEYEPEVLTAATRVGRTNVTAHVCGCASVWTLRGWPIPPPQWVTLFLHGRWGLALGDLELQKRVARDRIGIDLPSADGIYRKRSDIMKPHTSVTLVRYALCLYCWESMRRYTVWVKRGVFEVQGHALKG